MTYAPAHRPFYDAPSVFENVGALIDQFYAENFLRIFPDARVH